MKISSECDQTFEGDIYMVWLKIMKNGLKIVAKVLPDCKILQSIKQAVYARELYMSMCTHVLILPLK